MVEMVDDQQTVTLHIRDLSSDGGIGISHLDLDLDFGVWPLGRGEIGGKDGRRWKAEKEDRGRTVCQGWEEEYM